MRNKLLVLILSAIVGFISLSQEIIWVRAASYSIAGRAGAFAYVLFAFLAGIAFGAYLGEGFCRRRAIHPLRYLATVFFLSGILYFLSMRAIALAFMLSALSGVVVLYLSIFVLALLLGAVFPLLCQIGVKQSESVGSSVSWIYMANILGATAGPMFTGFVWLEISSFEQIVTQLSAGLVGLSLVLFYFADFSKKIKTTVILAGSVCVIFFLLSVEPFYFFEKVHYGEKFVERGAYKYSVENRSGVLAVASGEPLGVNDIVYGGAVYDGKFNVDPVVNDNGIQRTYLIGALHNKPRNVLQIGLGSGSWSRVLLRHRGVKRLEIVEINPGYSQLIESYPDAAQMFDDPRVSINIDDGRRWLRRNPEEKFDLIVMNTTFHWRSHASNLLSKEFLELCREHLNPGGIISYNTTGSQDVVYTATKVFKHVVMVGTFVTASDQAFISSSEKERNFLSYQRGGTALFSASNKEEHQIMLELANRDISYSNYLDPKRVHRVITDDNMLSEYKTGIFWFKNKGNWQAVFNKINS